MYARISIAISLLAYSINYISKKLDKHRENTANDKMRVLS